MLTARKYRLYPSDGERELMAQHFGCCRWVWNEALAYQERHRAEHGKFLSAFDLIKRLPALKEQHPWLKDVDSQALQQSLQDLGIALTNFYQKRARFPKFKSKQHRHQSCRFPQRVDVDAEMDQVHLPKLGRINAVIHRSLDGELRSITISKNPANQYHAACLVEDGLAQPKLTYTGKSVGVDLGLTDIIVTSDGLKVEHPNHYQKNMKALKHASQKLARAQRGSKRWEKARLRVAKIHLRIGNARKDYLHQLSRRLVSDNQVITFETLSIRRMLKTSWLAQAIGSSGWNMLIEFCKYKATRLGKVVMQAPGTFRSSKTCSCCGEVNIYLRLADRSWTCSSCGTHHDRDVNAGHNLDAWGQEHIALMVAWERTRSV